MSGETSEPRKPKGMHPVDKLSDVFIRKSATEPGWYADGAGLYLVTDPTGNKRWVARIVMNGKRRELGLGGYPDVSLKDAREKVAELRRMRAKGEDALQAHRAAKGATPTFEAIARKVHAETASERTNAKVETQWLRQVAKYVFPFFGDRPIDAVDQQDVIRAMAPIWTAKEETARKVFARVKLVLDWAKAHGHRSGDNPCEGARLGLPKQQRKAKSHEALPFAKLPAFMASLALSKASISNRLALEWLILTAARAGEVRFAAWSEIDREARTWTVPAGRMKTDEEHVVPLSDRCLSILDEVRAAHPKSELIFPRAGNEAWSENAFNNLAQDRGFGKITAHGFRSAFRDWAGETTGFDRDLAEMALAHAISNKVEAAYRRGKMLDKRRVMMQAYADFAAGKVAAGNVVPLWAASA